MTATAAAFRPRYYSEMVAERPGSYDDCALCAGLVTFEMATLRDGVTRDDGWWFDTIRLRELRDEAGLRPDGPLRLNDIAQYLRFVSDKAGLSPAFDLRYYPGHPGGDLRVTWDQFRTRISNGGVGILLGNPSAVRDPASPLRTKQLNDDYNHAIALFDGTTAGATVYDALTRKGPEWRGERVRWEDLRQFTEARRNGERIFGTPDAIACALAVTGYDSVEARLRRQLTTTQAQLSTLSLRMRAAQDEIKGLRADLAAANARIAELEAMPAPDCDAEVNATLDRVSDGMDALLASLRRA